MIKSLALQIVFFCNIIGISIAQETDSIPKHDTFTIQSTHVAEERVINVWLPDNYIESMSSFPTLYMADGGIEEDFPHVANTLAKLIRENKIPPMILVGIQNTQRRRDLTGKTTVERDKSIAPIVGGAEKFRAFIEDELIPAIQNRYNTTDVRSIIGESLAGLFVVETLLEAPNFDHLDNSLDWLFFVNDPSNDGDQTFPFLSSKKWGYNDLERRKKDLCLFVNSNCSGSGTISNGTFELMKMIIFNPFPLASH